MQSYYRILIQSLAILCLLISLIILASAAEILPPGDRYPGDEITIQGNTNFNTDNTILVEVYPASFGPVQKFDPVVMGGVSGVVPVERNEDSTKNFWSFTFSTAGWSPDLYIVRTEVIGKNSIRTETFHLLAPPHQLSPHDNDIRERPLDLTAREPAAGLSVLKTQKTGPDSESEEREDVPLPVTAPAIPLQAFTILLGIGIVTVLFVKPGRKIFKD